MNPVTLPAICQNPDCGRVFFGVNQVALGSPSMVATFTGNRIRPCPFCGDWGLVPDGRYGPTITEVFSPEQAKIVLAALSAIRGLVSRDEVVEAIDREFLFLSALKPFLPKDATQMTQYLQVLMVAVGLIVASSKSSPAPVIQLDKDTVEALHSVSAALARTQETKPPPPQPHSGQPGKVVTTDPIDPPNPKK